MALLNTQSLYEYRVILDHDGDFTTQWVMAPDSEHAAWAAQELSESRNCRLVNVIREDEW